MSEPDGDEHQWIHLYTQFKGASGDSVLCMMHKQTRKVAYFDVKLNRVLSKKEALNYRLDVTGFHLAYSAGANQDRK